ncbi:hypothetical protein ACFL6M_00730 [Candidatus Eisenbacteria bacterium]|uniref:TPM domain-containing protein n=1 Tax=Eiseniibacteriota bacterium TaxID=2212470 RepID=A0ABV6YII9_UNCEI
MLPKNATEGRRGNRRSFSHLLMNVDRRIIFLVIALSVALPLIFPLNLPVKSSREARAYYDEMEKLKAGDEIIFSFDYEPDVMAELDPMSLATLRHAFRKDVRVICLTTYAGGSGIAERILEQVTSEYDKTYGTDCVFLGYNPDPSATMLRMGESIKGTFPTDHYRTSTDELPLLETADSYADIELLVSITGSALAEYWIIWAGGKFNQRIISGNTAIQAVLLYPYFPAQISGFLGGLKGAAEYERMVGVDGAGVRGMDAQSMAHLLIVCFVVLGNIGFLIQKRRLSRGGDNSDSGNQGERA